MAPSSIRNGWQRNTSPRLISAEPVTSMMQRNRVRQAITVEAWDEEGGLAPPGATWLETEQAWNFALFTRHARGVTLLLYNAEDFVHPVLELQLDPLRHKTARVWHCL